MSWDEPRTIAERIAARLGLSVRDGDGDGGDAVLLIEAAQLAGLSDERLHAGAALVVVGAPGTASSADLVALRDAVAARDVVPALATFATVLDADGLREVPLVVAARPGNVRIPALLAAGPHALTLDRAVDADVEAASAASARVCVVTFEVAGMTGGGIGTASTAMAELLARTGHDVTLLFTGRQELTTATSERWQAHYAERGVRLVFVRDGLPPTNAPHVAVCSAYEVYRWLCREPPFDVVHLPDNLGHGVYAQAAKRQGLRFAETTFAIGTHGPTRWAAEANRVVLTREEFLVQDALERESVSRADVLLGPSRYLHDYLRDRGWQLPERTHVQPYAVSSAIRDARTGSGESKGGARVQQPTEIVFFGRLETRKGVATLCDALDLLVGDRGELPAFEVTFLGPVAQVLGMPADAYLAARAQRWPWPWRIVADRDQQGAAAYLCRPGVLAVMPSLVDNAPNAVSEAVALGVPLIAGRAGGTGELVAATQRDDHTFAGSTSPTGVLPVPLHEAMPSVDPRPLAELLRSRLMVPVAPAEPPVDPTAVEAAYDRWHRAVRRTRENGGAATTPEAGVLPSLAACVLFDGDEELLAAQLAALADVEVVVADLRGSPGGPIPSAEACGASVVQPARDGHAGDARTAAVAATRCALVAIVPPGDVPLPSFGEVLRRAAAATAADMYSCAVLDGRETTDGSLTDDAPAFVPFLAPPIAGLVHPAFTVGPYAIRRDALARLGGFAADARGEEGDHELLNRAAAAGMRLEVVPEPLAVKRRADRWVSIRSLQPHASAEPPYDDDQSLLAMRPLSDGATSDLLGLLLGAREEATRLARDLEHQHETYEQRAVEARGWIDQLEATAAQLRHDRHALLVSLAGLRTELAGLLEERTGLLEEQTALLEERDGLLAALELRRNALRVLAHDGKRHARRVLGALRRDRRG